MQEKKRSTSGLSFVTAVGNIGERVTENVVELDCSYSFKSPKGKVETSTVVLNLAMSEAELDEEGLTTGDRVMVIGSLITDPDTGNKQCACLKPHAGKLFKTADKKLKGVADFSCNVVTTMPGTVRESEYGTDVTIPAAINAYKGTTYVQLCMRPKDSVKKLALFKNLERGTSLAVRGKLNTSVSGKTGKKYLTLEVKDFGLLGRRENTAIEDSEARGKPKRSGPYPARGTHNTQSDSPAPEDYDDLPF